MDETLKKRSAVIVMLILLSFAAMLLGVTAGSSGIDPGGLLRLLDGTAEGAEFVIIRDLRMPRVLLSYLVGAALAVAGCAMQGVFENPLADSHILGVSSGAGLGAAAAISLGIGTAAFGIGPVAVSAFIGGIAAAALVYGLSRVGRRAGSLSLILTGVALSSLFSAITSFIMIINHDKMEQVLLWTMGSFASADWQKVRFAAAVIPAASILVLSQARRLNIMLTGTENARLLGVDTVLTTRALLLLTALLAAASVCSAGLIGFVGLMIPHILRALVGADHRYLIPASFLGGGMFLCLADTLARILVPPTEMPVGILTAVCGVPFFLYLTRRQAGGGRHG